MSFTGQLGIARSQLGNLELGDASAEGTVLIQSASNTLSLSQTAITTIPWHVTASNTLSLVSTVQVGRPIHVSCSNTLTITQTQHPMYPQVATSTLVISQASLLAHNYAKLVNQSLLFLSVADVTKLRLTSSTLVISQLATVAVSHGTFDTIVFAQSATVKLDPHNESVQQILVFDHSAVGHIERHFALTSSLTFTGVATAQRWRYASAFSVLPITNNVIPLKILFPHSTITFTQSATAVTVHTRRAFSSLSLEHELDRKVDYVLTVTSALEFNNVFHQIRDQSGGIINQPIVIGIIVPRIVTLQIPGLAITLPRPLIGDSEGGLGKIDLKRTETGETYTYVRRSVAKTLKYKFAITRLKAYEMRNFIQYALPIKITMLNWKGELWYGNITNNPFEFTAQSRKSGCEGELFEIDFEFEGVRLN